MTDRRHAVNCWTRLMTLSTISASDHFSTLGHYFSCLMQDLSGDAPYAIRSGYMNDDPLDTATLLRFRCPHQGILYMHPKHNDNTYINRSFSTRSQFLFSNAYRLFQVAHQYHYYQCAGDFQHSLIGHMTLPCIFDTRVRSTALEDVFKLLDDALEGLRDMTDDHFFGSYSKSLILKIIKLIVWTVILGPPPSNKLWSGWNLAVTPNAIDAYMTILNYRRISLPEHSAPDLCSKFNSMIYEPQNSYWLIVEKLIQLCRMYVGTMIGPSIVKDESDDSARLRSVLTAGGYTSESDIHLWDSMHLDDHLPGNKVHIDIPKTGLTVGSAATDVRQYINQHFAGQSFSKCKSRSNDDWYTFLSSSCPLLITSSWDRSGITRVHQPDTCIMSQSDKLNNLIFLELPKSVIQIQAIGQSSTDKGHWWSCVLKKYKNLNNYRPLLLSKPQVELINLSPIVKNWNRESDHDRTSSIFRSLMDMFTLVKLPHKHLPKKACISSITRLSIKIAFVLLHLLYRHIEPYFQCWDRFCSTDLIDALKISVEKIPQVQVFVDTDQKFSNYSSARINAILVSFVEAWLIRLPGNNFKGFSRIEDLAPLCNTWNFVYGQLGSWNPFEDGDIIICSLEFMRWSDDFQRTRRLRTVDKKIAIWLEFVDHEPLLDFILSSSLGSQISIYKHEIMIEWRKMLGYFEYKNPPHPSSDVVNLSEERFKSLQFDINQSLGGGVRIFNYDDQSVHSAYLNFTKTMMDPCEKQPEGFVSNHLFGNGHSCQSLPSKLNFWSEIHCAAYLRCHALHDVQSDRQLIFMGSWDNGAEKEVRKLAGWTSERSQRMIKFVNFSDLNRLTCPGVFGISTDVRHVCESHPGICQKTNGFREFFRNWWLLVVEITLARIQARSSSRFIPIDKKSPITPLSWHSDIMRPYEDYSDDRILPIIMDMHIEFYQLPFQAIADYEMYRNWMFQNRAEFATDLQSSHVTSVSTVNPASSCEPVLPRATSKLTPLTIDSSDNDGVDDESWIEYHRNLAAAVFRNAFFILSRVFSGASHSYLEQYDSKIVLMKSNSDHSDYQMVHRQGTSDFYTMITDTKPNRDPRLLSEVPDELFTMRHRLSEGSPLIAKDEISIPVFPFLDHSIQLDYSLPEVETPYFLALCETAACLLRDFTPGENDVLLEDSEDFLSREVLWCNPASTPPEFWPFLANATWMNPMNSHAVRLLHCSGCHLDESVMYPSALPSLAIRAVMGASVINASDNYLPRNKLPQYVKDEEMTREVKVHWLVSRDHRSTAEHQNWQHYEHEIPMAVGSLGFFNPPKSEDFFDKSLARTQDLIFQLMRRTCPLSVNFLESSYLSESEVCGIEFSLNKYLDAIATHVSNLIGDGGLNIWVVLSRSFRKRFVAQPDNDSVDYYPLGDALIEKLSLMVQHVVFDDTMTESLVSKQQPVGKLIYLLSDPRSISSDDGDMTNFADHFVRYHRKQLAANSWLNEIEIRCYIDELRRFYNVLLLVHRLNTIQIDDSSPVLIGLHSYNGWTDKTQSLDMDRWLAEHTYRSDQQASPSRRIKMAVDPFKNYYEKLNSVPQGEYLRRRNSQEDNREHSLSQLESSLNCCASDIMDLSNTAQEWRAFNENHELNI
eukprot:GHVH01014745.1.p1 GENE.GHVH01014745.1~~GHVH01014745.1.p1  ORF type:complete len:1618 (+),score=192.85 GHVH01014745.1:1413-6266(+)